MNNLNAQDPNRHIPSAAETGSVDKFARQFMKRHSTFSDAKGENIVIFARNADNFMRQNLIPSLEMGMIVIHNLKGEPYIRAKRGTQWILIQNGSTPTTGANRTFNQPHHSCHFNRYNWHRSS